jgi:hypothetical protein
MLRRRFVLIVTTALDRAATADRVGTGGATHHPAFGAAGALKALKTEENNLTSSAAGAS